VKDTTGEVWHIPSEYVELIEPNTIEEEKQDNKQLKKFNKGDKVKLTYANEVKRGVIFNVNEYDSYDVVIYGEDGFTTYDAEWIELIELDTQEGETEEKIEMPEGRFVYKVNMNEFLDKAEYIHFEDLTVMKVDIKYMSVDLVVKDIIQGTFGKGIILVLEDETEFHLSYQNDDACYKDFRQAQKQLYPKVSELI
jgi:hypothetical protein